MFLRQSASEKIATNNKKQKEKEKRKKRKTYVYLFVAENLLR